MRTNLLFLLITCFQNEASQVGLKVDTVKLDHSNTTIDKYQNETSNEDTQDSELKAPIEQDETHGNGVHGNKTGVNLVTDTSEMTHQRRYGEDCSDTCVPSCQDGWEQLGHHCYLVLENKKSWEGSEDYCQSKGGHLASVTTDSIHKYLLSKMSDKTIYAMWIGGVYRTNKFVWSDCSKWSFAKWGSSEE